MKSTSLHSASEQTGAYLQTINQKLEENTSRLGSYQKTSMLRIERKKDAKKNGKDSTEAKPDRPSRSAVATGPTSRSGGSWHWQYLVTAAEGGSEAVHWLSLR